MPALNEELMQITVKGVLTNPSGEEVLPKRSMRVTAATTSYSAAKSLEKEVVTDSDGFYEFELAAGTYLVEVKYDDAWVDLGYVSFDIEAEPIPV